MKSLRSTRKELGLTLTALELLTKIPYNALSKIERGLHTPWLQTRQTIERILGKINWLDTPVLSDIEPIESNWNDVERDFRALVRRMKGLPEEEQHIFVTTIIKQLIKIQEERQ